MLRAEDSGRERIPSEESHGHRAQGLTQGIFSQEMGHRITHTQVATISLTRNWILEDVANTASYVRQRLLVVCTPSLSPCTIKL